MGNPNKALLINFNQDGFVDATTSPDGGPLALRAADADEITVFG